MVVLVQKSVLRDHDTLALQLSFVDVLVLWNPFVFPGLPLMRGGADIELILLN